MNNTKKSYDPGYADSLKPTLVMRKQDVGDAHLWCEVSWDETVLVFSENMHFFVSDALFEETRKLGFHGLGVLNKALFDTDLSEGALL